jgi:RimJ/RimL family protein N-acetyltransferase
MTTVETARLVLRRLQPTDMDDYYQRIDADPDVMQTLPAQHPISRAEFDARILCNFGYIRLPSWTLQTLFLHRP